jgi:hypothetical protein
MREDFEVLRDSAVVRHEGSDYLSGRCPRDIALLLGLAATAALARTTIDAARLRRLAAHGDAHAVRVHGSAAGVTGERGVELSHAITLTPSIARREFIAKGLAE